jgi:hypothetical protein
MLKMHVDVKIFYLNDPIYFHQLSVKSNLHFDITGEYDLSLGTWAWNLERDQLVDFIQVFQDPIISTKFCLLL